MGNQQSAPEGYTQQESFARLQTNANQARLVGVPDPVRQTQGAKDVLTAASPRGLNLLEVTNADASPIDEKEEYCSKFSQMEGLRRLQKEVGDRTALEPGCGWIYSQSGRSQGAFGGTKKTQSGSIQEVPFRAVLNGETFTMDLEGQEMKITNDLKQQYPTCESLKPLANFPDLVNVLGYCKETKKVIPIERSPGVAARARYSDHPDFRCSGEIIVPELATKENCAAATTARQGFRNPTSADKAGSAYISGGASFANYHSVFNTPQWAIQNERGTPMRRPTNTVRGVVESFTDTVTCESRGNLRAKDKDCLDAAARESGFQASGSYTPYLNSGIEPAALVSYSKITNTDISIGALLDGTKSMNEVIGILRNVKINMSSTDQRIKAAAIDLYVTAGTYQNEFNMCEWFDEWTENDTVLSPTMKDAARYAKCMENYWRNKGGDSRGVSFPTLETYNGKKVEQFKQDVRLNTSAIQSGNALTYEKSQTQSGALAEHIGVATYQETTSGTVVAPPQACVYNLEDIPGQTCPGFFPMTHKRPQVEKKVVITRAALGGGDCTYKDGRTISDGQSIVVPCESSQPLIPQDCVWTPNITECSKTCGTGTQLKTWTKTTYENALGSCPPKPADETLVCQGNNCSANDCKYTVIESQKCPDGSDTSKCGQQFKRITTYQLDSQNPSQAAKFCPTPNPKIEDCPIIQCPASDTSALADCEAAFYVDTDYRGNAVRLPIGEYDMGVMISKGIQNHSIRSMRLGKGVDVIAYYNSAFRNPQQTYTSSATNLGGFDRNISGLKVIYKQGGVCSPPSPQISDCEVWAYYEKNFGSRPGYPAYTVLRAGEYNWGDSFIKSWEMNQVQDGQVNNRPIDDQIKSIRIGKGMKVLAYPNPDFKDYETVYTSDVLDLGEKYGFGPGISSMRIVPVNNQCVTITRLTGKCSVRAPLGYFKLDEQSQTDWFIYSDQYQNNGNGFFYMQNKQENNWLKSTNNGNAAYKSLILTPRDMFNEDIMGKLEDISNRNNIGYTWDDLGDPTKNPRAFCFFFELQEYDQRSGKYVPSTKQSSKLFLQRAGRPTDQGKYGYSLMGSWLIGKNDTPNAEHEPWRSYFGANKNLGPLLDFYGGSEGTPQWGQVYLLSYAIWNP